MIKLGLKTYVSLCLLLHSIGTWAQIDARGENRRGDTQNFSGIDETADNLFFHITAFDVVMFIVILAACYVYGKIWKGCTYMILILGIVFYLLLKL